MRADCRGPHGEDSVGLYGCRTLTVEVSGQQLGPLEFGRGCNVAENKNEGC